MSDSTTSAPSPSPRGERLRTVLRFVMAAAMIVVGVAHFASPTPFVRIVPSFLPAPLMLVYVSGLFEILGGVGLLVPRTRRAASIGLIALYVAVFPANINMAVNDISLDGVNHAPPLVLWGRLPFQVLFIVWAWWVGKPDRRIADRAG